MKGLPYHVFSERKPDILCTSAGSLWRKQCRRESNLFRPKNYALVVLSLVTTRRAATVGVFVTSAKRDILPVCTRSESKNKDHHKSSQNQVKKSQIQIMKSAMKDFNHHNTKKQPQLLLHTVFLNEANTQSAAIIPVWLSSKTQPSQEVLVYLGFSERHNLCSK